MIDISDGLAADVAHICSESCCGAVLQADAIPVSEAARSLKDGRSPLDHALSDGEDFELVFAVPPLVGQQLLQVQPVSGITLVHIGECIDQGLWLEEKGQRDVLEPRGYVHHLQ
jgi:thiamine-monophosphate kinase